MIPGYNFIRKDRNSHGGGLIVYIKENLACIHLEDLETVDTEILWMEVRHNVQRSVLTQLIRFARASSNLNDFNYRNKALTAELLRQGYLYLKLRKAFSKFYRRHSALLEKYSVSLKTLLQQGISEPEFYGDLVYIFRKIVGKSNFSEQFRKLINRYKRIGYSLDIMRQTACLVVNPIIVDGYASLFNCTTAVRTSDSMTASS